MFGLSVISREPFSRSGGVASASRKVVRLTVALAMGLALLSGCSSQVSEDIQSETTVADSDVPRRVTFAQKTPPELLTDFESGDVPFIVDIRDAAAFQQGHVPGALNIPYTEFKQRMDEISRGVDILVVGNIGGSAHEAARMLVEAEYGGPYVWNLSGGMENWVLHNGPLDN